MKNERLGDILVSKKIITDEQLDYVLEIRSATGQKIGAVLQDYGWITDKELANVLAEQSGWQFFSGEYQPNTTIIEKFGLEFLIEHMAYPLNSSDFIKIVLSGSDNTEITDKFEQELGRRINYFIGVEHQIKQAFDIFSRREYEKKLKRNREDFLPNENNLKEFADYFLNLAIVMGASDIHIRTSHRKIGEIRFRIDGFLKFVDCVKEEYIGGLINVLLVRANIDTADAIHFQDGQFNHHYINRNVDIRVAYMPLVSMGRKLTLRIHNTLKTTVPLLDLGYSKENLSKIQKMLKRSCGLILFTGPTGCGKTTTLYSILNSLKSISKEVLTIEDPVENKLNLVTQIEVSKAQGITFNEAIVNFLRNDPDIILIGEIRDQESAAACVSASNTGHLVFSTLHNTHPINALIRLINLEIELSNLADSLIGIVTQRLVRKLCPSCKESYVINKKTLDEFEIQFIDDDTKTIFRNKGCKQCFNNGYSGRTVVSEVLYITEEIKELILKNDIKKINKLLRSDKNYIFFEQDAGTLIKEGITSLEEVVRVLT